MIGLGESRELAENNKVDRLYITGSEETWVSSKHIN